MDRIVIIFRNPLPGPYMLHVTSEYEQVSEVMLPSFSLTRADISALDLKAHQTSMTL